MTPMVHGSNEALPTAVKLQTVSVVLFDIFIKFNEAGTNFEH